MEQPSVTLRLDCEPTERSASERRQKGLVGVVVAGGILLRLVAYLHNRSLWLDEAMVASSVIRRSFLELLLPLDYSQAVPVGFLYLVRAATALFGPGEFALRLVPLLAGLAAVPLFYILARRYVGRAPALIGLALFAVSENLIYYSAELKQYSTDVLLTILVLLAVEPVLRGSTKTRDHLILGAAGVLGVWFSHPVIFVLAGAGAGLAFLSIQKRDWKRLATVSVVGLAWLASFGLNYGLFARGLAADESKVSAFDYTFMPLSVSLEALEWVRWAFSGLPHRTLRLPTNLGCAVIASLSMVIGGVRLFARDKVRGVCLVAPVAFCLVASAMHKYPFRGRLLLFLAPALLILIGLGAQWLMASRRRRAVRVAGLAFVAVLLVMPTATAVYYAVNAYGEEEMRPVLEQMLARQRPGDVVWLYSSAYPAFLYYGEVYGYAPEQHVVWCEVPEEPGECQSAVERLFSENSLRMWFIFSHEKGGPRERMLKTLDRVATRLDTVEVKRVAAYLYRAEVRGGEARLQAEASDARQ